MGWFHLLLSFGFYFPKCGKSLLEKGEEDGPWISNGFEGDLMIFVAPCYILLSPNHHACYKQSFPSKGWPKFQPRDSLLGFFVLDHLKAPVGIWNLEFLLIYLQLEEFMTLMTLNRLKSVDNSNLYALNLYVYFPFVQVPLWLLRSYFIHPSFQAGFNSGLVSGFLFGKYTGMFQNWKLVHIFPYMSGKNTMGIIKQYWNSTFPWNILIKIVHSMPIVDQHFNMSTSPISDAYAAINISGTAGCRFVWSLEIAEPNLQPQRMHFSMYHEGS